MNLFKNILTFCIICWTYGSVALLGTIYLNNENFEIAGIMGFLILSSILRQVLNIIFHKKRSTLPVFYVSIIYGFNFFLFLIKFEIFIAFFNLLLGYIVTKSMLKIINTSFYDAIKDSKLQLKNLIKVKL